MTLALVKAFAKALRQIQDTTKRAELCKFVISVFKQFQPSFDEDRFRGEARAQLI